MLESKLETVTKQAVNDVGFEMVSVKVKGGDRRVVEILIDTFDNTQSVKLADCRKVSQHVSAVLDVENVVAGKYFLEVSSCGIERPLLKIEDFERFKGRHVKVVLYSQLNEKLKYKGQIVDVADNSIKLSSNDEILDLDYSNIKKANLYLTDEQFKKLIK